MYEDLTNKIKQNFDLSQEQEVSREQFTLLGQINKHQQRVKQLEKDDIQISYDITTVSEIISIKIDKLTDVGTFFGDKPLIAIWTDKVSPSNQNKEITIEKNTVKIKKQTLEKYVYAKHIYTK